MSNISNFIVVFKERLRTHRGTLKSVGAVAGGNLAVSFLGAIGGILVARFVGPEVNGQFRIYTIPLMYLTILHLGTPDGLSRQLPYYIGKDQPEKNIDLVASIGAWNRFISIVVSTGFVLCALYSLMQRDNYGFWGWLSQALACWSVFFGIFLGATYRTLNNFIALSRIQVIQAFLTFGMVFLLPVAKFYGLCARAAIPSICGLFLLERSSPLPVKYHFEYGAFKEIVKVGLPFFIWIYLSASLWVATESLLVLKIGGVTYLGYFGVALVVREGLLVLPQSIQQVLMPKIIEEFARQDNIKKIIKKMSIITFAITAIMIIVVLMFSYIIQAFVPIFIPKYTQGIMLIQICLWFAVVQAASFPLNILFATGKPWLYGRSLLFGIPLFLLSTWLLMPVYGGAIAVVLGSMAGRIARALAVYLDIWLLLRNPETVTS